MSTFIRGQAGLIDELTAKRLLLTNRLHADVQRLNNGQRPVLNKTERENMLGQVTTYTGLIQWLQSADVHVVSEREYDDTFKIGGFGSPGQVASAITTY